MRTKKQNPNKWQQQQEKHRQEQQQAQEQQQEKHRQQQQQRQLSSRSETSHLVPHLAALARVAEHKVSVHSQQAL